eukprot:g434.t1
MLSLLGTVALAAVAQASSDECPAGHFIDLNQRCTACPPGSYTDSANTYEHCTPCAANTTSAAGATVCDACAAGTETLAPAERDPAPTPDDGACTLSTHCMEKVGQHVAQLQAGKEGHCPFYWQAGVRAALEAGFCKGHGEYDVSDAATWGTNMVHAWKRPGFRRCWGQIQPHVRGLEFPCQIERYDPDPLVCSLTDQCLDGIATQFHVRALAEAGGETCSASWNKVLVDLIVHQKACPAPAGWDPVALERNPTRAKEALAHVWNSARYRGCRRAIRFGTFVRPGSGDIAAVRACDPAAACYPSDVARGDPWLSKAWPAACTAAQVTNAKAAESPICPAPDRFCTWQLADAARKAATTAFINSRGEASVPRAVVTMPAFRCSLTQLQVLEHCGEQSCSMPPLCSRVRQCPELPPLCSYNKSGVIQPASEPPTKPVPLVGETLVTPQRWAVTPDKGAYWVTNKGNMFPSTSSDPDSDACVVTNRMIIDACGEQSIQKPTSALSFYAYWDSTDAYVVDEAAAMAKYPDGVQFLALSARSPKCVLRGDATAVSVDYKSSDGSRRSALSFKVVYDPDYYALDSRQESGDWISDCPLKAFVAHHTADGAYVDFTCASLAGEAVVAAAQTNIVALKLIATGKVGETHIAVSGRDSLRGGKFTYSSSAPLAIRSGDCYHPSSWELVTTQHSLKADDLNETVQALNLAVSARACNAFGDQVEARVSYAAGKQSRLIAFSLQYDARELQLLSYRSAHSGLACHKFDLEATTYRYAKQERVLGHVRILCATDGDYIPRELNDVVVAKFSSAARTSVKSLLSIVANKEAVLRTMTMSTLVAPPITVEQQNVCPRPKQPHYTVFKRSVTVAHSPEERFQMLSLQVHSKACVTIGDVSQAAVNYTASDGKWSRSLGVTLKWSKKVFTLLQMKAGKLNGCDLKVFGKSSYTEKNGHLMWACASLSGEKVVPPRFNFLLLAEFQAMGVTTGQAHFSVHGVDKYGDHSYMYQRATRVEIKAGNCPQAASLPIATGERFGTITHMAKMGNMVQGLSLEAVTRKCVLKNNYVHVDVNYMAVGENGAQAKTPAPNNALGGSGFAYSAASDILLTSGPCTFAPTPAPQQATGTPSPTPPPTKDVIQMLAEAPNATGAYQLLDLSVEADSCMQAGDRAKAWVNYHTSDDDAASALAFKLAYDSEFFAFESKVISPKFNQHKCALFGFKDVHG